MSASFFFCVLIHTYIQAVTGEKFESTNRMTYTLCHRSQMSLSGEQNRHSNRHEPYSIVLFVTRKIAPFENEIRKERASAHCACLQLRGLRLSLWCSWRSSRVQKFARVASPTRIPGLKPRGVWVSSRERWSSLEKRPGVDDVAVASVVETSSSIIPVGVEGLSLAMEESARLPGWFLGWSLVLESFGWVFYAKCRKLPDKLDSVLSEGILGLPTSRLFLLKVFFGVSKN